MTKRLLFLIFIIAFACVSFLLVKKIVFDKKLLHGGDCYAIFLTNGQVYFGHVDKLTKEILVLSKVYYFRTQTNLGGEEFNKKSESNLQLSLVKLGKEIHSPTDQMYINRNQILFWEKLSKDSDLVKAMEKL